METGRRFHINPYEKQNKHRDDPSNATVVWWDINRCPVPNDYNPRLVRPSIESALNKYCGSGPVTIYAMGNLKLIHPFELAAISASGIMMRHTYIGLDGIFEDFFVWAKRHPPPSRMMLISSKGVDIHNFIPMFEDDDYTFIRAYPCHNAPQELLWPNIIHQSLESIPIFPDKPSSYFCSHCEFHANSLRDFQYHLDSHSVKIPLVAEENTTPTTVVWWDINSCPVPQGYDAGCVRPSIKAALNMSGFSGPLTIYCMGNMIDVPKQDKIAISLSGVSMIHNEFDIMQMLDPLLVWAEYNPPPANIMLISNAKVEFRDFLFDLEATGFTVIHAYPTSDNSSQEKFLWENLLIETPVEKEKSNETVEIHWRCLICEFSSKRYHEFTRHLLSFEHRDKVSAWLT